MIVVGGLNQWTDEEYDKRIAEAKAIADRHWPNDKATHHRFMRLAEGVSERPWRTIKIMQADVIKSVMTGMVGSGWPGDKPMEGKWRVVTRKPKDAQEFKDAINGKHWDEVEMAFEKLEAKDIN